MLEVALRHMFSQLDAFLDARPLNRLCLPHGYVLSGIAAKAHPDPFLSYRRRETATVTLRLPVVWKVLRGSIPARASDTPTTEEPDRLRELLEDFVKRGGLGSAGRVDLTRWELERPRDEIPSRGTARDTHWTVQARFEAR